MLIEMMTKRKMVQCSEGCSFISMMTAEKVGPHKRAFPSRVIVQGKGAQISIPTILLKKVGLQMRAFPVRSSRLEQILELLPATTQDQCELWEPILEILKNGMDEKVRQSAWIFHMH